MPFLGPCKDGYVAYNYTDHQLCLKFVGNKVPYPEASARCQAEGGDLFKLETVAKYTIMTDYLGVWWHFIYFYMENIQ